MVYNYNNSGGDEGSSGDMTSKFNESGLQIQRLDRLWDKCHSISRIGDLTGWKWVLDCIWRELSPDAYKKDANISDDKNKYFTRMKVINKKIIISQILHDTRNVQGAIYRALEEKEIFLRILQMEVGKGTSWRNAEEDDIE